jgi:hypothetical protein
MSSFKLRKEKNCLNCGHHVEKHFCPECGQENIEVREDALHMVMHAVADYFHFEHKFFATLNPLLLKPGKLTTEYVAGKRVKFIHPIRLYIFVSIVFFLFVLSGKNSKEQKESKETVTSEKPLTEKEKNKLIDRQLSGVTTSLKYVPISKHKKDSILREAKADIEKDFKDDSSGTVKNKKIKFGSLIAPTDTTVFAYDKRQSLLPKEKRDGFIKHYIKRRMIELNQYPNPGEKFAEGLLHNIPKMMFLLLPLFALILMVVYINKQRYYYEHLIYSFHTHAAIFLVVLLTMLLQWLTKFVFDVSGWLSFACFIYIVWYIYRSLRTFYGSTRWITVLKMFFLFFCYNVVGTICFLLILAVSFVMI